MRHGGVAIMIHNSLLFTHIDLNSNLVACAATVSTSPPITVVSIYIECGQVITTQDLVQLANQLPENTIYGGDLNAHSPLWGGESWDRRGRMVADWVESQSLCILNNNQPTFISSRGNSSAIDVTLTSPPIASHLDWTLHPEMEGSDHFPIIIRPGISTPNTRPLVRFREELADWTGFRRKVEVEANLRTPSSNINKEAAQITRILRVSAATCIPTSNPSPRNQPIWMNGHILSLIRGKNRAWKVFQRRPTTENLITYRRKSAIAKKEIKLAKRESWVSFAQSIDPSLNLADAWRKVKSIFGNRSSHLISHLTSNNNTHTNSESIANELAETWANYSKDTSFSQEIILQKHNFSITEAPYSPDPTKKMTNPITLTELINTLSECKGSAPGQDKITYRILKETPLAFKERILSLYNLILLEGFFPHTWKNAIQVPIRKKNISANSATLTPRDLRPISLLPCISRLLEKILGKRLAPVLETVLNNNQHGFRKHRGTTSLLLELENKAQEALTRKQNFHILSLDIEKAYDRVCRHIIGRQLQIWGFDIAFIQLTTNFLSFRSSQVRVNGFMSTRKSIENILPQGSPLSTHLFNIFSHALSNQLNDIDGLDHYMYADNILLTTTNENRQEVFRKAKFTLDMWCRKTGAKIPYDKAEYMIISRKRRSRLEALTIDETEINPQPKIKILGLHVQKSFNWCEHIKHTTNQIRRTNNLARALTAKNKGASAQAILHITKTIMRGIINYCLPLYGGGSKNELKKLQAAVNSTLRTAAGALPSTPNNALWIETGMKSINETIDIARVKLVAKHWLDNNRPHNSSLHQICSTQTTIQMKSALGKALKKTIELGTPLPKMLNPPISTQNITYSIDQVNHYIQIDKEGKNSLPPEAHKRKHLQLLASLKNTIKIYSDGSKKDNHTSGAFVMTGPTDSSYHTQRKICFHPCTSVYEAEINALYQAIIEAAKHRNKVYIFTDSKSALTAITNHKNNEPIVRIIRQIIAAKHGQIILRWVPGHVGIPGNEMADEIAGQTNNHTHTETVPSLSTFIKRYALEELSRDGEAKWQRSSTHLAQHWPTTTRPEYPANLSRRQSQIIFRLRTGHTRLTHGHLFQRTPRPGCVGCQIALTPRHVLSECPRTKAFFLNNVPPLRDLLDPKNYSRLFQLLEYLRIYHLI